MAALIQDGVLGIITGILTTVVLFLVKVLWDAKLHPFLQELRYGGVKIDGKWQGCGSDTANSWQTEYILFLTQNAFELGGTSSLKHQSNSNQYEIHFNVAGRVWEGYAILNFTPVDRRVTSYATAMFKIGGGGATLIGQLAYRDVFQEMVTAEPVMLSRNVI